jgi:hypothetical protein
VGWYSAGDYTSERSAFGRTSRTVFPICPKLLKMGFAMRDRAFSEEGSCSRLSNRENHTSSFDDDASPLRESTCHNESSTLVLSNSGVHPLSDDAENRYFGRSEDRFVRNLKAVVFLVLFVVTLAVCLVIYFLTDKAQEDEFHASYVRVVIQCPILYTLSHHAPPFCCTSASLDQPLGLFIHSKTSWRRKLLP